MWQRCFLPALLASLAAPWLCSCFPAAPPPAVPKRVLEALGANGVRFLRGADRAELLEVGTPASQEAKRYKVFHHSVKYPPAPLGKAFARKLATALLDERAYSPNVLANPAYPRYVLRLRSGRESAALHISSLGGQGWVLDLYFHGADDKDTGVVRLRRLPALPELLKELQAKGKLKDVR